MADCAASKQPANPTDGKVYLKVEGDNAVNYTFSYSTSPKGNWTQVGDPVSADLISTQTAGGFTGTMVGIYATGRLLEAKINRENTHFLVDRHIPIGWIAT